MRLFSMGAFGIVVKQIQGFTTDFFTMLVFRAEPTLMPGFRHEINTVIVENIGSD